jgi:monothiol glutaredoxin
MGREFKMSRSILDEDKIHERVRDKVVNGNSDIVDEVKQAVESHPIVVVGMDQNPHCRRALKYLKQSGHSFKYLEYGHYLKGWRRRTALKMWTGWQTFPMVFVKGTLIGGASDLKLLISNKEFTSLL